MKIGSSLNHDYNLVLFPSSTTPWEIAWRVNQVWLKNNRDPDYTVYDGKVPFSLSRKAELQPVSE